MSACAAVAPFGDFSFLSVVASVCAISQIARTEFFRPKKERSSSASRSALRSRRLHPCFKAMWASEWTRML